ncbi:hypothetical protein RFI_05904 [Reticulomyxa filosa]|uniref:Uncharacterized protein n=1 Tax=Reticulomyxa filosa TaxID=46433 RepID=X6NY19_RETFI|nr:hypothetical protein RFI_05904 [Reticulomyxa filosa]|eukprot:ETO31215.1 hypothetical protein RFI_05904 [Reticulomyxa filosa]
MTVKQKIIKSISHQWVTKPTKTSRHRPGTELFLDKNEQMESIKLIKKWAKDGSLSKLAVEFMEQLLDKTDLLRCDRPTDPILYFTSEEGFQLLRLSEYNTFILLHELMPNIKVSLMDKYCSWFEHLCTSIMQEEISVGSMEILVTDRRLKRLLSLWESFELRSDAVNVSVVTKLADEFEEITKNVELISIFFNKSGISAAFYGKDLQELHKSYTEMTPAQNWPQLTLKEALKRDWTLFNDWRKYFLAFEKVQISDISLSMWTSSVSRLEYLWSVKPFSKINLYKLDEWVREKVRELVRDLDDFDLEKYVHRFFEQEIDGQKIDSHDWNEQKSIAGIKEELAKTLEQYPPTQRQFHSGTVVDILTKVRDNFKTTMTKLKDKTITGSAISTDFGLLRGKQLEEICRQVRHMFQPHNDTIEKLVLSAVEQNEMGCTFLQPPIQIESVQSEVITIGLIMRIFNFKMPSIKHQGDDNQERVLVRVIKSEIARVMDAEGSESVRGNSIRWTNIMQACELSENLENWLKFITYHAILKKTGSMWKHRIDEYDQIGTNLEHVFKCLDGVDALKLLRDVTNTFSLLYKRETKPDWEDKEWQRKKALLRSFDNIEMKNILTFWQINKLLFFWKMKQKKERDYYLKGTHALQNYYFLKT